MSRCVAELSGVDLGEDKPRLRSGAPSWQGPCSGQNPQREREAAQRWGRVGR